MKKYIYKVYGVDGHRQRDSFFPSETIECSRGVVHFARCDETGTNEYTKVIIYADNKENADLELQAHLLDGAFECCRVGRVEEV